MRQCRSRFGKRGKARRTVQHVPVLAPQKLRVAPIRDVGDDDQGHCAGVLPGYRAELHKIPAAARWVAPFFRAEAVRGVQRAATIMAIAAGQVLRQVGSTQPIRLCADHLCQASICVQDPSALRVHHIDGRVHFVEHAHETLVGALQRQAQPGQQDDEDDEDPHHHEAIPIEQFRPRIAVRRAEAEQPAQAGGGSDRKPRIASCVPGGERDRQQVKAAESQFVATEVVESADPCGEQQRQREPPAGTGRCDQGTARQSRRRQGHRAIHGDRREMVGVTA